jgi:cytochrome P450
MCPSLTAGMATIDFQIDEDMFSPEVIRDPYSYYGHLRETDPVHWNDLHKTWVVTRHDDLTWVGRNPELFSSAVFLRDQNPPYPPIADEDIAEHRFVKQSLVKRLTNIDPPEHHDPRALLRPYFTAAASERWRVLVRDAVANLLAAVEGHSSMDVMREFAVPLPLNVIAEIMDIPPSDRSWVREVAEKLLIGPRTDPGRMREIGTAMRTFFDFITPLVEERKKKPGDDLISLLARGEADGVLTREHLLQNASLLLVAGHETTINLICNGVLAFIQHPDQWDRLRADPDGLAASATDEILRFESPVKSVERIATTDVELRGKTIRAGERVRIFFSGANRDPEKFPDPDVFDIRRPPNRHLAFGHGIHLCLGATLARIEGQEVFTALARRFERLHLETDPLEYAPMVDLRSLRALRVSW